MTRAAPVRPRAVILAGGLLLASVFGAGCSSGTDPQTVPPAATVPSPAPGPAGPGVPAGPTSTSGPGSATSGPGGPTDGPDGTAPPPESTVPATDAQGRPRPTEPPVSQTPESRVPVVTGPKQVPATDAPTGAKCNAEAINKATAADIPAGSRLEKLGCSRGYARAQYSGGIVAWLKANGADWVAVDVGIAEQMVVPGPVPADIQKELLGI